MKKHNLEIKKINFARSGRQILENISFSIFSGELLVVTGPNGSGKTTLLRLISGLLQLNEGSISLDNQVINNSQNLLSHGRIHYLGHSNCLKNSLTVRENLKLWNLLLFRKVDIPFEILKKFSFDSLTNVTVGMLSDGQKRRLALLKLFLSKRKIWLLDEPLRGLDSQASDIFLSEIEKHQKLGGIVIYTTHRKNESLKENQILQL